jgi:hypothetical protein
MNCPSTASHRARRAACGARAAGLPVVYGEGSYGDKLAADASGNRCDRTPLSAVFSPRLRDIIAIVSRMIVVGSTVYRNFIAGRRSMV